MPMHRTGFEVFANPKPWLRKVDMFLMQWRDGDRRFFLVPGTSGDGWLDDFRFVESPRGDAPEATLSLYDEGAQQLLDQLWNAGLRPTAGVDNAGQLAATEHHLADMRSLVSHQLKVELPKLKP